MRCAQCPGPRLLPDAALGWHAYQRVNTQWRYVASGFGASATGLDYAGVVAALQLFHGELREAGVDDVTVADLMEDVQAVEQAVLEVRQERNSEGQAANDHG